MPNDKTRLESNILIGGAAIAAAYFLIVKPLLNAVGVDPADKAAIQGQATIDPADNFFSTQFSPMVDYFNANPSTDGNGNPLTMQQYYQAAMAQYDAGNLTTQRNLSQTVAWTESIHEALHFTWQVATDIPAIQGVFAQMSTQIQVAQVAACYFYNYNEDLFSDLQGSIFKAGMTPGDLALLIQQINALPTQ